jgi:hypothetical protein
MSNHYSRLPSKFERSDPRCTIRWSTDILQSQHAPAFISVTLIDRRVRWRNEFTSM